MKIRERMREETHTGVGCRRVVRHSGGESGDGSEVIGGGVVVNMLVTRGWLGGGDARGETKGERKGDRNVQ